MSDLPHSTRTKSTEASTKQSAISESSVCDQWRKPRIESSASIPHGTTPETNQCTADRDVEASEAVEVKL